MNFFQKCPGQRGPNADCVRLRKYFKLDRLSSQVIADIALVLIFFV